MISWQLSKRVSADQYHLTVSRAQVLTHWGRVFFWSYPLTNYQSQMIAGSSFFFQWFILNMLCICHYGPALLGFWFQNDLGSENSASFFESRGGEDLILPWSRVGHALRPILCSDWSKFDRWVHAENLCSILKVVYFDSWSWQSFVSTCDVFNCLFPLDVQNEKQLLSGVFCYSWLVCLLGFWLRNTSLVKIR